MPSISDIARYISLQKVEFKIFKCQNFVQNFNFTEDIVEMQLSSYMYKQPAYTCTYTYTYSYLSWEDL